jgi:hypothetical protein
MGSANELEYQLLLAHGLHVLALHKHESLNADVLQGVWEV